MTEKVILVTEIKREEGERGGREKERARKKVTV